MLSYVWVSSVSDIFLNIWFVAAIWMGLALAASLVSIWTGISVALIEIFVGVLAGNFLHLQAVVILSAFVPTLFAQKLFQPTKDAMHAWGRLYRRRLGILSVKDADEDINGPID